MTIGLDGEPPTMDPAANSLSLANGSIYGAIFETLIRATPTKPLEPLLLEAMPTESADRLSWTLKLRKGITFHDGIAFDGTAVKFNLQRQKVSVFNGASLLLLNDVIVDPADPLTVKLTLSKPWTALPTVLSGVDGIMISPKSGAGGKSIARNPLGTGPYKFTSWTAGQQMEFARFDGYWGAQKAPAGSLVFKFVPIEAARVAAFDAGELDAYTTIVESAANDAKAKGAQVSAPPPTGYGMIMLNTSAPPFDDVRVRQAMEIGYDRDAITKAYGGQNYADYSSSPFIKDSEWWAPPAEAPRYDVAKAKQLIADYGKPVKFTLLALKGSQELEDATRATIEYWKQAGMDVQLQILADLSTYVTDVITGAYDAVGWIGGSIGDPDTITYALFHSGGSSNYMKYSNPAVDAALDEARGSSDPAQRKKDYADVQQILRQDEPALITSHGRIYIVASKKLTGLDPDFFFPSRTVAPTS